MTTNEKEAPAPAEELTGQDRLFVRIYLANGMDATAAAIEAGFPKNIAGVVGSELLNKPAVRRALKEDVEERCGKFGLDADSAFDMLLSVINFDANEFSSYVVYCCPRCWSSDDRPQLDMFEFYARKDEWDAREKALARDDMWYEPEPFPYELWDKGKDPNPKCPYCRGNGTGEVVIHDTRNLSPVGKLLYAGVKKGRDGTEVVVMNKEKARTELLTILGLFREKSDADYSDHVSAEVLDVLFEQTMRRGLARQEETNADRGLDIEDAEYAGLKRRFLASPDGKDGDD